MADHSDRQPNTIRQYYRVQAGIYDATRWSFLFGRNRLLSQLPLKRAAESTLLEVGCGTGRNLRRLAARHHDLHLIGVDVSPHMLARAAKATLPFSKRVRLLEKPYGPDPVQASPSVDIVLFSYSLSMFNPGWEQAIDQARADLRPGGHIAVVDFHRTPVTPIRWWLGKNHVRMEAHLLPYLQARFRTESVTVQPIGLGLWSYFTFIGIKP